MHIKSLSFILIILYFSSFCCHRCGADLLIKKLNLKEKEKKTSNRINRRRLDTGYYPINIKIDYTILEIQKKN